MKKKKAWINFFQAANVLLRLGEEIKVDWDSDDSYDYDDECIVITQLDQFCHYRDKG